jgi:hypothetical protein
MGLKTAYRIFKRKLSLSNTQVSAAVFINMVVFSVTILFMPWTWGQGGYILALVFGMTAAWNEELKAIPAS